MSTTPQSTINDQDWAQLWKMADDRYDALCMDVMKAISEGKSLSAVLALVGDSMNNCDHIDDESVALFNRAAARLAES